MNAIIKNTREEIAIPITKASSKSKLWYILAGRNEPVIEVVL